MQYVHGYSNVESRRLSDQARTLIHLLHDGISYPPGSRILEAGCGVGAQTVTLARRNPSCTIVSVDRSEESIEAARAAVIEHHLTNVEFVVGDLYELPFEAASFDHLFLCFVLEHVKAPQAILERLLVSIVPGGTVTVIEGDHGSAYFHPDSEDARAAIACLVELQRRAGGNALIGRELYPLLVQAGLRRVRVDPLLVYADASRPELVAGFTLATFTAMVQGVEDAVLGSGMMTPEGWQRAIAALRRCAEPSGTFNYSFFRGVGVR